MKQTERIREALRYIQKFKNITIVIRLDDSLFDSPLLGSHIHDISLLYETGIKVVIVPGAAKHITEVLNAYSIPWKFHETTRITAEHGINLIKMAAFDTSNRIMSLFAGEHKNAVIGNWVRARGHGVIDGIDFGTAGKIEKIHTESLVRALDDGFIPIIPCIGWSATGKPYNVSSVELAVAVATALKAEKLFFVSVGTTISIHDFEFPPQATVSPEGRLAAISVDDIEQFISINTDTAKSRAANSDIAKSQSSVFELFEQGKKACLHGVTRAHILDADIDGVIPAEIYSELGSGSMIYKNNYGSFRPMTREDISQVLSLMNPFVERGILLARSHEDLEQNYSHYIVYEIDGGIRACGALLNYPENVGEFAAIAVDESYAHIGIGPQLMERLLDQAIKNKLKRVVVLTTQAADWFERFGFVAGSIDHLPEARKAKWSEKRASKVLVKEL